MNLENWSECVPSTSAAGRHRLALTAPRERIAHFLKDYRRAWKLSQAQLARQAKTTQRVVSLLEAGRYNPTLELLERLAEACNMELDVAIRPQRRT